MLAIPEQHSPVRTVGVFFGASPQAQTLVCPECYAELGHPHADTATPLPAYRALRHKDVQCSPYVGCGRKIDTAE